MARVTAPTGARMCLCGQGAIAAGSRAETCRRCQRGLPVTAAALVESLDSAVRSAFGGHEFPGLLAASRAAQLSAFTPPPPVEHEWTLDRLGEPVFQVLVGGRPTPQGSKKSFVDKAGNARMKESSDDSDAKHLTTWRSDVVVAAKAVKPAGWVPLDGDVVMDLVYSFKRPKGHPKTIRTFPSTRSTGDFEKLDRAVNDALTDAGIWTDDSIVIAHRHHAAYFAGDPAPDTLPAGEQGAVIRLWVVAREKL